MLMHVIFKLTYCFFTVSLTISFNIYCYKMVNNLMMYLKSQHNYVLPKWSLNIVISLLLLFDLIQILIVLISSSLVFKYYNQFNQIASPNDDGICSQTSYSYLVYFICYEMSSFISYPTLIVFIYYLTDADFDGNISVEYYRGSLDGTEEIDSYLKTLGPSVKSQSIKNFDELQKSMGLHESELLSSNFLAKSNSRKKQYTSQNFKVKLQENIKFETNQSNKLNELHFSNNNRQSSRKTNQILSNSDLSINEDSVNTQIYQ